MTAAHDPPPPERRGTTTDDATAGTSSVDASAAADTDPPPGWSPHDRRSPLTAPWEPIFARREARALRLALRLREAHCNSRGLAHGGLISALADNAMGLSAIVAARADGLDPQGAVTVSLSVDFVESARPGEWLEIAPVVVRAGRTLAFVECRATVGERTVARASATFRMG